MDWFSGHVAEFYRMMGAVLAANLLTVAFVWAIMNYNRREEEGTEREAGAGTYLAVILVVFFFLAGGLYAAGFFDRFVARFADRFI